MRPARTVAAALLSLAALAGAGCSNDDADSVTTTIDAESEREEVAAIVNLLFDAAESRDGEQACALLTTRAQLYFSAWLRGTEDFDEDASEAEATEDCVRAVRDQDTVPENDFEYTAEGVDFATGRKGESPDADAYVRCEFRGSIFVARVGDTWKVGVPACLD